MRVKRHYLHDMGKRVIDIGRQGENEATAIFFDVASWVSEYPLGVMAAAITTPSGKLQATGVRLIANDLLWMITDKETLEAGKGKIEITLLHDGAVVKSRVAEYIVSPSITGSTPGEAPEPGELPEYMLFPVDVEMIDPDAQGYGQLDTDKLSLHIPRGERGLTGVQGPRGERGERGEPGKDYVLTEADKDEIIAAVLSVYPVAEEEVF